LSDRHVSRRPFAVPAPLSPGSFWFGRNLRGR
jgi:hypothetical protein